MSFNGLNSGFDLGSSLFNENEFGKETPPQNAENALKIMAFRTEHPWGVAPTISEFAELLEKTPPNEDNKEFIQKVLLYFDSLDLTPDQSKRIALVWCDYVRQYNDSDFLFQRMALLLKKPDFRDGFKAVRERFQFMKENIDLDSLKVPFDGDMELVMILAKKPANKQNIAKNIYYRMALRSMDASITPLSKFNPIVEKLPRNDAEAWKLAALVFLKGADSTHLEMLLQNLKENNCTEEAYLVLHDALDRGFNFDPEYGYWCADLMSKEASFALVSKMEAKMPIDLNCKTEVRTRLYCSFALLKQDPKWAISALTIQDSKVWSGLEELIVGCAENFPVHANAFLAKLPHLNELHPLYERVKALWQKHPTDIGATHEEKKAELLKNHTFLLARVSEPDFQKELQEVIQTELQMNRLADAYSLLSLYKITEAGLWVTFIENAGKTQDIATQRKACLAWLKLPSSSKRDCWQTVSQMIPKCDYDDLLKSLQCVHDEIPLFQPKFLLQSAQAMQGMKSLTKEKRIALLNELTSLRIKTLGMEESDKSAQELDELLINCLIEVPTRVNLIYCSMLLKQTTQTASTPEIYKKLLNAAAHLKKDENNSFLCERLFEMGIEFLESMSRNTDKRKAQFLEILEKVIALNSPFTKTEVFNRIFGEKLIASITAEKVPPFIEKYLDAVIQEQLEKPVEQKLLYDQFLRINKFVHFIFLRVDRKEAFKKYLNFAFQTIRLLKAENFKNAILFKCLSDFRLNNKEPKLYKLLTDKCFEELKNKNTSIKDRLMIYNSLFIKITELTNNNLRDPELIKQFVNCWDIQNLATAAYHFNRCLPIAERIKDSDEAFSIYEIIFAKCVNNLYQYDFNEEPSSRLNFGIVLDFARRCLTWFKENRDQKDFCGKLSEFALCDFPNDPEIAEKFLLKIKEVYLEFRPEKIPSDLKTTYDNLDVLFEHNIDDVNKKSFTKLFKMLVETSLQMPNINNGWRFFEFLKKYKAKLQVETLEKSFSDLLKIHHAMGLGIRYIEDLVSIACSLETPQGGHAALVIRLLTLSLKEMAKENFNNCGLVFIQLRKLHKYCAERQLINDTLSQQVNHTLKNLQSVLPE